MNKLIFVGFVLLVSCNNKPDRSPQTLSSQESIDIQSVNSLSKEAGLVSLKTNCYSCHNPNSESHDNMLAPPLAGIKYKYKKMYPNEKSFVIQMSDFIDAPTKENALMKGPVKRFGLMPKTTLSKKEIQELVKYIYHEELEIPKWFPEHFEEEHAVKWENRNNQ